MFVNQIVFCCRNREMSHPDELKTNLQEKLFLGRTLLSKLADKSSLKKVQGIPKLEKKIRQELRFLEKFEDPAFFSGLKKEHISCSNLIHLGCIVIFKAPTQWILTVIPDYYFTNKVPTMFWLKMHLRFIILSGIERLKQTFFNIFNDYGLCTIKTLLHISKIM